MAKDELKRRDFLMGGALAAGALGDVQAQAQTKAGRSQGKAPSRRSILNYNENMEYRRLGKTGLMVSAVCLGGHWKRIETMVGKSKVPAKYWDNDWSYLKLPDLYQNRDEVIGRCIEVGINYLDAMAAPEVVAYGRVLKGRRDKIYFGYDWWAKGPIFPEWRSAKKLIQGLDENLKQAGLEYVDIWRITLPQEGIPDLGELQRAEEATVGALEIAKKQGKARFTGISTHNRTWLKSYIETYPDQIQVALFPYTANSKQLPTESVFDAIKEYDVGVFAIKPFADNKLFVGDGSQTSPHAQEDDRRARLAIRYILSNPAITAPIPGMINAHQVDNAALAVRERRQLDLQEKAELEAAGRQMWARLEPNYQWLKNWEYV
ncbi:MAG: aldo/keto reductase [Bryobacterales bacterium]|nr:aldo/keto reductase [Bryobacterales bacterium]